MRAPVASIRSTTSRRSPGRFRPLAFESSWQVRSPFLSFATSSTLRALTSRCSMWMDDTSRRGFPSRAPIRVASPSIQDNTVRHSFAVAPPFLVLIDLRKRSNVDTRASRIRKAPRPGTVNLSRISLYLRMVLMALPASWNSAHRTAARTDSRLSAVNSSPALAARLVKDSISFRSALAPVAARASNCRVTPASSRKRARARQVPGVSWFLLIEPTFRLAKAVYPKAAYPKSSSVEASQASKSERLMRR